MVEAWDTAGFHPEGPGLCLNVICVGAAMLVRRRASADESGRSHPRVSQGSRWSPIRDSGFYARLGAVGSCPPGRSAQSVLVCWSAKLNYPFAWIYGNSMYFLLCKWVDWVYRRCVCTEWINRSSHFPSFYHTGISWVSSFTLFHWHLCVLESQSVNMSPWAHDCLLKQLRK